VSNYVTLKALTSKAEKKLEKYGITWNISGKVEDYKRDIFFFPISENYLYINPVTKRVRNPEKDLGKNFYPIVAQSSIGSMWIAQGNDPDYAIINIV